MVERQHGVGFTAAEVGLQVDDGAGAFLAGYPAQRPPQQVGETIGEVGALEEGDGIRVFAVRILADGDCMQVGGELSGGERTPHDLLVGADEVAPSGEPFPSFQFDGGAPPVLTVRLLGQHGALQLQLDRLYVGGRIWRIRCAQQQNHRIEGAQHLFA